MSLIQTRSSAVTIPGYPTFGAVVATSLSNIESIDVSVDNTSSVQRSVSGNMTVDILYKKRTWVITFAMLNETDYVRLKLLHANQLTNNVYPEIQITGGCTGIGLTGGWVKVYIPDFKVTHSPEFSDFQSGSNVQITFVEV